MSYKKRFAIFVVVVFSQNSFAEYQNIDTIMAKAAKKGTELSRLLKDIDLKPVGKTSDGRSLIKVLRDQGGSIYEKKGIKSGDLVISDKVNKSYEQKPLRFINLKSSLKNNIE